LQLLAAKTAEADEKPPTVKLPKLTGSNAVVADSWFFQ